MSTTTKTKPKTLSDWQAAHDKNVLVPNRIRAAFEKMKAAGEDWHYEQDFERLADVGHLDMVKFREQFAKHIVQSTAVRGKAVKIGWFADPKVAAKARGE